MRRFLLLIFLLFVVFVGCQEKSTQPKPSNNSADLKESLEKANRYLVNDEETDIQNYIERHGYEMIATGTGLRYLVLKEGTGELIQPGQKVSLAYELYDITGDLVYSSDNEGLITFVVGKGGAVSGLDEAVRHLRKGDVARLIVPSPLGYGLLGDQNAITGRATLIYLVKVLEVN